jgi:hypothetical protein
MDAMTDKIDTSTEAVNDCADWCDVALADNRLGTFLRSLARERDEARNAALDEAAKVADAYEPRCDTCPRGVAAAILALKTKVLS